MLLFTDVRRAFTSNLRTISTTDSEQARLQGTGIDEPTMQRYFAWRRSMAMMVVLATSLSAGLATYRQRTEPAGQPGIFEAMSQNLVEKTQSAVDTKGIVDKAKSAVDEASIVVEAAKAKLEDEIEENERVKTALEELKGAVEAAKAARSAKQEADDSDDEPAARSAPDKKTPEGSSADALEEDPDDEPEPALGRFADAVELVSLYAMPLAALAVVLFWMQFRRTFRILLAGFAFAFFVPLLLALCPWSWWGYVEPEIKPQQDPLQYFKLLIEGVQEGAGYLATLLPTVLSLVPGVQRACLRVKTLLPESMLPGWFLVAASPFYALFLLVIFVGINQAASDPLFLIGMFLFLAAPLIYVFKADAFTSPLTTEVEQRRIRRVQQSVGALTALAGGLLVAFLATREIFGVHLVGLDPKSSLLRPMDLAEFFLELVGRSMFMTVLGADLFMWMNMTAWKNSKAFEGTPDAAGYDRVMEAMQQVAK